MKEGQPAAAAVSSSTNGSLTGSLMGATSNASPTLNGPLLPLSSSGSTTVLSAAGGIVNSASYNSLPGLYKGGGNNSAYNTGDQQPFLSSPGKGLLGSKSDLWDSLSHGRDDGKLPSATENIPLVYEPKRPNEISDLLADPLGQTVSGKRGGQEGLKIKINRKNNASRNQADAQPNQAAKPKANRKNTKTNGASTTADASMTSTESATTPSAEDNKDDSLTGAKKGRKRNSERKEKGAPRGRGKAPQAQNGDNDKSASQERPTKKSKLDAAYRREQATSSSAVNAETMIEPEYLAPLEAGSNIFLEGIVWHETSGGILVVNVTWRGKSYVGTLLDSTIHDCAPPATRICDSPPSDIDVTNRSPTKERSQKRGRGGATVLSEGEVHAPLALRCGKRRGANFQTPASPARSDTATSTKNGRRGRGSTSSARSQRTSEETVPELPSPTDEIKPKRGRRPTSGPATPTSAGVPEPTTPSFPKATSEPVACTVRNCEKKFGNAEGLRFHLQAQHGLQSLPSFDEEKSTDSQSDTKEDLNSSTDSIASPKATMTSALSVLPLSNVSEAPQSKPETLPAPTHHFPAARPEDLIVPGTHSRAVDMEESVNAEEESKRSKQRRKQPNPVSSQHKKTVDSNGETTSRATSKEPSARAEGPLVTSSPVHAAQSNQDAVMGQRGPGEKTLVPQDLSRSAKDNAAPKPESSFRGPLLDPLPRPLDATGPLDLKIASPLSNRVSSVDQYTSSPLADSSKMTTAPSEGRTSPAYSDISDDETAEPKKDLPPVDKAASNFPFVGLLAPLTMMAPMLNVDRNGSPAEQAKAMMPMSAFPGFMYPAAGRPSETFSPTFSTLSQSPQPRPSDSVDSKPSSSPSPLYSSKSSSRSKETDKSDGKGRSPLARDPSAKNDVKSEPGKSKDESSRKSTPEHDTKPLVNGTDRPQAYPAPPAYMMNGAYRNNAAQSFPMPMSFMNGQRGPPMFNPTPEQIMSMSMFAFNGRSPVGLPPGLPQALPTQEPNVMDMMQQRMYPSSAVQNPHKIHELEKSSKATGSSSSDKKPSASPVTRKSESSTKSFPSSSDSHRQRNGSSMLNGSPLPSQMIGSPPVDPFNLFPGQYPPPISLPQ
ncbi:hypothetical protein RvY_08819 [Ramazzottius varieornatus]|uniref:C2H2-type domain-containing protein n=1 Tax=Ramazzottius varieornatus TaxID=947166 RepID=A0A1D1V7C0_RAMVA|nr:hypothetical protein RvY_08819 [Ramazzottius varieornatus]